MNLPRLPRSDGQASWFALSAPSAFIGFLVFVVGLSNLMTPERVIEDFGVFKAGTHIAMSIIWNTAYVISGVWTIVALWKRRIDWEVYSIVVLLGANLMSVLYSIEQLGISNATRSVVVFAGLIVFKAMRGYALWRGGTFAIPGWTQQVIDGGDR